MESRTNVDKARKTKVISPWRPIGLVLTACLLLSAGLQSAYAQQPYKLRIAGQSPPIFEYVYWHHAIQNGFLKKYGIEPSFIGFAAGLTGTQALVGGSVDVACEGVSGTIVAAAQGANTRIIHMVNADNTYAVLVKDTINTPQDLRGKRFGITQMGAISQTYAALWLDAAGVKGGAAGDVVDWVPVGGTAARVRAVIAGQAEAGLITIGDWFSLKNEKGVKLLGKLADSLPPIPLTTCSMSSKLIAERPDIALAYVSGTLDAVRHARTPEGKTAYIKLARELAPNKLTDADYDEIYDYYFGPKGNPIAIDPNGGMDPFVLPVNIDMMVADKTLQAPVPIDSVWDPRFVTAYLSKNGWYDVRTGKSRVYLRDLIKGRD